MSQENNKDRLYYVIIALSIVLVLLAATLFVSSQDTKGNDAEHTIQMRGNAEIMAVPDKATLNIGVVVQAPNADEATEENADIMNAVIEELKDIGLEDSEIQTSSVSVSPVYNYDGRTPTIEGYSASNNVRITTSKLDSLGDMIDRSVAAGANQIGGISFSVSDEKQKELRDELISEAVSDATSKAEMLASSLGVDIVGVKSSYIADTREPRLFYEEVAMDAEMAERPTPIEPGESSISMSVQVTYLIE
ncbi:SIMPL domain-containing protein [Methanosalsum natronophilum]|uniref:SIMPL domain-containing protein n=1 Tax=Methanosalsum natronophilum TaxID=768733 RepID=A0A3R7XIQ5_9EURY|nr:MAG: SIMPL domain-containing protein [Methanosalsum natronophilum]